MKFPRFGGVRRRVNSARVRPYEVSGQKSPFFDHEATQNYSFGTILFARQNLKI